MTNRRAAQLFVALLSLLLLIAVLRQLTFGHPGMVYIKDTKVVLGGESAPLLDTLRKMPEANEQAIRSLLAQSHRYRPERPIFISRHETTNLQYRLFLNPAVMMPEVIRRYAGTELPPEHNFRPQTLNDIKYNSNRQPVVEVSWYDANAFCRFNNMRLPSADEFEAAFQTEATLRNRQQMDYPLMAGSDETLVVPIETGKFNPPNSVWQELIGNVMEWVSPENGQYQLMGYSYKQYDKDYRHQHFIPWKHHFASAASRANDFGFRCVYQAPANFQPKRLSAPVVDHNGVKCWNTRGNLGPGRFDLQSADNLPFAAAGMMFPDQLCQLPQKDYNLGPDPKITSTELIRQHPSGYTDYLLGRPPQSKHMKPFWLDIREVSVKDYLRFLDSPGFDDTLHAHPEQPSGYDHTPLKWNAQLTGKDLNEPVSGVSWWDAFAYCSWQNKRLPSATQWETAAKSADGRLYAWGNDMDAQAADITPQGIEGLTRTISEWTSTFVLGNDSAIVKGGSKLFDWTVFGRAYVELKVSRKTKSPAIGFRCAQ